MATIAYINGRTGKAMLAFEQSEAKSALSEFCYWKKMDQKLKKWDSILNVGSLADDFLKEAKILLNIQK